MKFYVFILGMTLTLSSCFEQDEVLPAIAKEQVEIELDLSENQATFLDLHNLSTSYNQEFEDWQLKFQNNSNKWSIYLNTLSKVAVYNTGITTYDSISESYDLEDVNWQLDIPTNSGSYPGIGTWGDFSFDAPQLYKNVYLIRWVNDGVTQVDKIQILDARAGFYHIRYGSLDGSYVNSVWIEKKENRQHSYFSLALNKTLQSVEPAKDEWNLCLTYLTDSIAKHKNLPFVSTANPYFGIYQGLLINQANSTVFLDTTRSIDEIDYFNSNNLAFRNIDELYNIFSRWDERTQDLIFDEKMVVLIKDDENIFAVAPIGLERGKLSSYALKLEIKKL